MAHFARIKHNMCKIFLQIFFRNKVPFVFGDIRPYAAVYTGFNTAAYGRNSTKTRYPLFLEKFDTKFFAYHVWSMQTIPLMEPKHLHGSTFYAKMFCVCVFFVFPKTRYPLFLLNYVLPYAAVKVNMYTHCIHIVYIVTTCQLVTMYTICMQCVYILTLKPVYLYICYVYSMYTYSFWNLAVYLYIC